MTDINDGGPAFPREATIDTMRGPVPEQPGMSLRDWFAGQALAGMLADSTLGGTTDGLTQSAYRIADAMLAARSAKL